MSGRNFNGFYPNEVTLSTPSYNPVTVSGRIETSIGAAIYGSAGTVWTITNQGTIENTVSGASVGSPSASAGIFLYSGGRVTNQSHGLISGYNGIFSFTGYNTTSVVNAGTIAGTGVKGPGLFLHAGGYVSNQSGGTITGYDAIDGNGNRGTEVITSGGATTTITLGALTVMNAGLLSGNVGVAIETGGYVTNQSGGSIEALDNGILAVNDAATISNDGTIAGTTINGRGVVLFGGGYVTNQTRGVIKGGAYGIYTKGTDALNSSFSLVPIDVVTVVNSGDIEGTQGPSRGIDFQSSGGITNQSGATISGGEFGIYSNGEVIFRQTFVNAGSIGGTAASGVGIYLRFGGHVTNEEGGIISGGAAGLFSYTFGGVAGAVIKNAGRILATAAGSKGVSIYSSNSLTNQSSGVISGGGVGVYATGAANVVNYGTINLIGVGVAGIQLQSINMYVGAPTITNQSGGTISGYTGILGSPGAAGGFETVVNAGDIAATGPRATGIYLESGGYVGNLHGGTITGVAGVFTGYTNSFDILSGGVGSVVNAGDIAGTGDAGVHLLVGGGVTNQSGGTIHGYTGIYGAKGGSVTVLNDGGITASGSKAAAIDLNSAGAAVSNVTNQSGGTISGYIGIEVSDGAGTVTNAGIISGSGAGDALSFSDSGFNSELVVDPGAVFHGLVDGGSPITPLLVTEGEFSTLILASGASAGSLAGLGTRFVDFGEVTVSTGADWTLTGANTLAAGATLTELGGARLTVTGTLVNDGAIVIDPSTLIAGGLIGTGSVTIDAGSTLTVGGTVSAGETIVFAGTNGVLNILDPTGFAGTIQGKGPTDQVNVARTLVWTAAQNTNFANAFNWDDVTDAKNPASAPPGVLDTAEFLATGGVVTGTGTVAVLQFGSSGQWALGSGTALISETGVTVGNGMLAVDAGARIASEGTVDVISGTGGLAASVTVSGKNAAWNSAGNLIVGDAGIGSLAIQADGAVVSNAGTIAAQSSASGSSVNVTGTGSSWQITGALTVGNAGSGALNITSGATVTAATLDAGAQSTGAGIVTISGDNASLVTTGSLSVGDAGAGELSILNGANATIGGDLDIGLAGGSGNIDIDGAAGTLTLDANIVAGAGAAVLTIGPNSTLVQDNGGVIAGQNFVENVYGNLDPAFADGGTVNVKNSETITYTAYVANTTFDMPQGVTFTLETPTVYGTTSFNLGGSAADTSGSELIANAGSFGSGSSVTFNDALSTLVIGIDQLATIDVPPSGTSGFTAVPNPDLGMTLIGEFEGTIKDFLPGDSIVVDTSVAATFSRSGSVVSVIANGATLGVLRFDNAADALAASVTPGALVDQVAPCFAAGTRIATERGEVAVEDVRVGDRVRVVLGGGFAEVVWVGRREVECGGHAQPRKVWPVRVGAGAFGVGVPVRDVWLSPDHAVFVGGVLVPVKLLVNGTTIVQVPVERVTYCHVELAEHDVLLAEGLPAESYLDMRDGSNYAHRAGAVRLIPDYAARMWEAFGCAKLVVTGVELERAREVVRRFAEARAAA